MYRLNTKIADQEWEFDEISRLNHQTFSEEIQQHDKTSTGLLIDKFHAENQYIICLKESEIVGMVALRDRRPFSLDIKLNNIDDYLPPHKLSCEIRLLTIKPAFRNSSVILFLLREIIYQAVRKKYDLVLISGILAQLRMYRSLGFVPFGPVVGDSVKFQPMYLTPEFFFQSRHYSRTLTDQNKIINALPGPVNVKDIVSEEFRKLPESHRSTGFHQNYMNICTTLCRFVQAENVQIFTGSATLANEVILAHLLALSIKGLIVSNGEFGNRIMHQAKSQKICFEAYSAGFGDGLDLDCIEQLLEKDTAIRWLFVVHCETSTGVINDIPKIIHMCNQRNILIALDCVSSFGIIPLDLSKVYMASASSGKAVGSFAGLSMVFYNELLQIPENSIPLYLDIWYYINKNGIPFTLNSNALNALGAAVKTIDAEKRYQDISGKSSWLRNQITGINPDLLCFGNNELHPAIVTLKLPGSMHSSALGESLENQNILVNYNSEYLHRHNLIQICLFSDISEEELQYLAGVLKSLLVP
jgi:aspartate aminotransferase-like enzyme